MTQFLAFSGGKDSTAMAYRLAELGESFTLLFTPTGNELPDLRAHIERVVKDTGAPFVTPQNLPLSAWIEKWRALPNAYQRWCTRVIKIEPCAAFLKAHPGSTLMVGLRADEEERRGGIYGDSVTYRLPFHEWAWGIVEVKRYLREKGVTVPRRTDCAVCPFQRLDEWWDLWREHPEMYAEGERWEAMTAHTFRRPGRDSFPAGLAEMRAAFERGREPRAVLARRQMTCLGDDEEETRCRVCSL